MEAHTQTPDAQLVACCRQGDELAWRELVERYSRYVYAITQQAYRLPLHDAEDIFQEVFARTYQHLHRLRDDGAIRPWIGQLTRRLCIDRLRQADREQPAEAALDVPEEDETLARLDEAMSVREALVTLPAACREILDRFFCQDQSYAAIAEALALPAGTIASRISRCLSKLRAALEGTTRDPEKP